MNPVCKSCKHMTRESGVWSCKVSNCIQDSKLSNKYVSNTAKMEEQNRSFKDCLSKRDDTIRELELDNYRLRKKAGEIT